MKRYKKFSAGLVILILTVPHPLSYCGDWACFQHDNAHSGNSTADFSSKDIAPLWVFTPTQHVWNYKQGSSVWSSSACIADVNGRDLVFAGLYNNNLYALDAKDGSIVWRFIAGNSLAHAPCFAVIDNRPMLYIACADRTIYAIDAATGEKAWGYETMPWEYEVSDAVVSSPVIIFVDNKPMLACSVWNNNRTPFKNIQQGELFVLDPANGKKIYSVVLSSMFLNSPAFAYVNGKPMIFVSSRDGNVTALNAADGAVLWKVTSCGEVRSSPAVSVTGKEARVFIGSRFGNLYCLDALTGRIIWTKKTGHAIDSTPAVTAIGDKTFVYAGSYDRNVYAMDGRTGRELWRFRTGDYVTSSCALANISGGPAVFVHSLDNKLYCLSGKTGSLIWSFELGGLIWKYNTRGDTIWSSPSVAGAGDKVLLIFPCYDGKLYAFSVKKGEKS